MGWMIDYKKYGWDDTAKKLGWIGNELIGNGWFGLLNGVFYDTSDAMFTMQ